MDAVGVPARDIDGERLLADLNRLRSFGARDGGVVRPALSAADLAARRWLAGRMQETGLEVCWDPAGNLFGLAPGRSLLIGSHADSQPEGGWLDGAYGVVCALEIARSRRLSDRNDVSVVAFSDEEGRFGPLLGSRYWTGELSGAALSQCRDAAGLAFGEVAAGVPELQRAAPVPLDRFHGFFEPHIEQGPVLERAGERIGVVDAIAGLRQIELVVGGEQNHAGTTPMALRRDALQGFVRLAAALDDALRAMANDTAVWTIGRVGIHPNAVSIVPGRVEAALQLRDATDDALDAMVARIADVVAAFRAGAAWTVEMRLVSSLAASRLAPAVCALCAEEAAAQAPRRWRRMMSGALHDAGVVARHLPAAMLFVPSIGGISHSFAEDTDAEDLVLGCAVAAAVAARVADAWARGNA